MDILATTPLTQLSTHTLLCASKRFLLQEISNCKIMACVRKQFNLDARWLRQKCLHFGATRFPASKTTFLWELFRVYHIIR
jgi:hypothetical protein